MGCYMQSRNLLFVLCNRQTPFPYVLAYVKHSQGIIWLWFTYAKPYPGIIGAMINIHQTIPSVQFGYDLRMPNYILSNVNIRCGLDVTPAHLRKLWSTSCCCCYCCCCWCCCWSGVVVVVALAYKTTAWNHIVLLLRARTVRKCRCWRENHC